VDGGTVANDDGVKERNWRANGEWEGIGELANGGRLPSRLEGRGDNGGSVYDVGVSKVGEGLRGAGGRGKRRR
jgi:hypothetical protein